MHAYEILIEMGIEFGVLMLLIALEEYIMKAMRPESDHA